MKTTEHQKNLCFLLTFLPLKQFNLTKIHFLIVCRNHLPLICKFKMGMKCSIGGSSLAAVYNMSSFFSLGFYANMIKEALEKTISEGKVCVLADY